MKIKAIAIIIVFLLLFISLSQRSVGDSETGQNSYNISEVRPLINQTGKQAYGFFPDFSPDGKEITFLCGINKSVAVWIMDANGNNSRVLYANKSIDSDFGPPRFSPDGKNICFVMMYKNHSSGNIETSLDLLIRSGDSWDPHTVEHRKIYRTISGDEGDIMFPSWSPDGEKIIFEIDYAFYRENNGLWTISPDGTNLTQILQGVEGASYPSFSPDGSGILYMPYGDKGEYELWLMNSDGTNRHRILDEPWYPDQARFTPDGRIVFVSGRVSPHSSELSAPSIWMMNQDGGNKILLVPSAFGNDIFTHMPAMSPDMKRLVFSHGLTSSYLYYIDDSTGEWKDSDGDGVYDGIDGAPGNPYAGYIGENPVMGVIMKNLFPIAIGIILIGSMVAIYITRKKKGGNNEYGDPQKKE